MTKKPLPKKGDTVTWSTTQGKTEGVLEKVVTKETKVKGHVAKATKDDAQVLVRSAKSGKEAIHKPDALTKK